MNWADFVAAVNDHLSVDASRRGTEALRARSIKNAVIDLQRMIEQYRQGHTTLYREQNLMKFGNAHLGSFPDFARPSAFYIYNSITSAQGAVISGDFSGADFSPADFAVNGGGSQNSGSSSGGSGAPDFNPADFDPTDFATVQGSGSGGDFDPADFGSEDFLVTGLPSGSLSPSFIRRNRLDFHPWIQRQELVNGQCYRAYRYAISPEAKKFLIYPQISEKYSTYLLLVWSGIKETFQDSDKVPWPEAAAEAVALYVKAGLQRNVDKNIPLARETERDYAMRRTALYREARDAMDAEKPDEENIGADDVVAPPPP